MRWWLLFVVALTLSVAATQPRDERIVIPASASSEAEVFVVWDGRLMRVGTVHQFRDQAREIRAKQRTQFIFDVRE